MNGFQAASITVTGVKNCKTIKQTCACMYISHPVALMLLGTTKTKNHTTPILSIFHPQ